MNRRWIGLFVAAALVCSSFSSFSAPIESTQAGLLNVMTNKVEQKNLVMTMLDGKELNTEITGFTNDVNGSTVVYVPISVIFRELGASTTWVSSQKKLTASYKGKTFVLNIGKNTLTVNGKSSPIREGVPVMLMKFAGTERVMAPMSILSDFAGLETTFTPETRTANINQPLEKIKGVTWDTNTKYKQLRVKTSKEVKFTNYAIDGTEFGGKSKVIVEFQNTVLDASVLTSYTFNDPEILSATLVNPGKKPPRIRLEVETQNKMGVYSYYDKAASEQVVQFVNTVNDITLEKRDNTDAVVIQTGVESNLNVKYLDGKVVLDFINSRLTMNKGNAGEQKVNKAGISTISYSQFDPTFEYQPGDLVTRVVLNYTSLSDSTTAFIRKDSDKVLVYLKGDPNKGITYDKTSSATAEFAYNMTGTADVVKQLDPSSNALVVNVPKSTAALTPFTKDIKDNIVQSVSVDDQSDPNAYRVTFKLEQGTICEDHSSGTQIAYAFKNPLIANSNNQRKLIVLDAGHGGNDPGALGKFTGVKEKDLTLRAVKLLKKELEARGYEVALTRSDDYRVELYQRTDFANEINATAFISIHYNSADSLTAKGIEVLYNPELTGLKYELSRSIYSNLLSQTNALGRGIIKRPLLVVPRETKMPSCLIEMGFLSNPDEEAKVQNESYMLLQVKAISQGLVDYLASQGL